MLIRDAQEGEAPTVWLILTSRRGLSKNDCKSHLKQLMKSLRKRWPAIQWAVIAEVQKRGSLHLNLVCKGVPVSEYRDLYYRAAEIWCARTGADPDAQAVRKIFDAPGLFGYLLDPGKHQAPPHGWHGHRVTFSRRGSGYFGRPVLVVRKEVRTLRRERAGYQNTTGQWELVRISRSERDLRPSPSPRVAKLDEAPVDIKLPSQPLGKPDDVAVVDHAQAVDLPHLGVIASRHGASTLDDAGSDLVAHDL